MSSVSRALLGALACSLASLAAPAAHAQDAADAGPTDVLPPGHPPAGGAGGPMGGGGQMPDPRMMSGQVRGQEGDPAGRLTVKVIQGTFRTDDLGNRVNDWPRDGVVHLVAYDAADQVSVESKPLDAEGRAIFDKLATDGSKAYRAIALLPRGATVDRVISDPIVMPPMVGLRLMLAGDALDSTRPPIDDQSRADELGGGVAPPAGQVVVRVRGQTRGAGPVHLAVVGGEELGQAEAILHPIIVGARASIAAGKADPALRDGLVRVTVMRTGQPGHDHEDGVVGAVVDILDAAAPADAKPVASGTAGGDGMVSFDALPAGKRYLARVTAQGATATSQPFERPARGGLTFAASATYQEEQSLEARFEGVAPDPAKVYHAWIEAGGRRYLSMPFMLTPAKGAATGLFVYPNLVFSFHGGSELDDTRLFFQMQISLINPTNSPRDPGKDGLVIPLPRGFRAGSVDEQVASKVKVIEQGLLWRGPIPPGQRDFLGGFALDVEGGKVAIDLPLPLGAWQSQLVFEDMPGLTIDVPPSARKDVRKGQNGRSFVVLGNINIEPGKAMVLTVAGLPQKQLWQRYAPALAGLVVLALLGWAGLGIYRGRATAGADDERERLYDELVALEERLANKKIDAGRHARDKQKLVARLAALNTEAERAADEAEGAPDAR